MTPSEFHCEDCGGDIAEYAPVCPACGAPLDWSEANKVEENAGPVTHEDTTKTHPAASTLHATTNSGTIRRISFSRLTAMEKLEIMWSWFWRTLVVSTIAILVAMAIGFCFGLLIGLFLVQLKISLEPFKPLFQVLGYALGLAAGFISLSFLIKWLTQSRLGAYRFWLVQEAPFEHPAPKLSDSLSSPDISQPTPSSVSHNSPDPAS